MDSQTTLQVYSPSNLASTDNRILRLEVCKQLPNVESIQKCVGDIQKIEKSIDVFTLNPLFFIGGFILAATLVIYLRGKK